MLPPDSNPQINSESVSKAREYISNIFGLLNGLLADGRVYLVSDCFFTAGLTFVTLAAPALMPAGYSIELTKSNELPSEMAADIQPLREEPVGKFVWRLYQEHESAYGVYRFGELIDAKNHF